MSMNPFPFPMFRYPWSFLGSPIEQFLNRPIQQLRGLSFSSQVNPKYRGFSCDVISSQFCKSSYSQLPCWFPLSIARYRKIQQNVPLLFCLFAGRQKPISFLHVPLCEVGLMKYEFLISCESFGIPDFSLYVQALKFQVFLVRIIPSVSGPVIRETHIKLSFLTPAEALPVTCTQQNPVSRKPTVQRKV